MCGVCRTLLAEAEQDQIARIVSDDVIALEAVDGSNVPWANRPLFPHEVRATTRFSEIDDLTEGATAEAGETLDPLQAAAVATALAALFGDLDSIRPAEFADRLTQLEANMPNAYRDLQNKAAGNMRDLFARVYTASSGLLIAEATRQGADVDTTPRPGDPDRFGPVAASPAAYPWQRVTGKLHAVHMDPAQMIKAAITRDEVAATASALTTDGVKDLAHQGVLAAGGIGRNETAGELEPDQIFASEILDGITCGPCSTVDGREYGDLDEATADYPAGGYTRCLGGGRCRGTLVFIWGEPSGE